VRYWFIRHYTLEGYERIKKALQEAKKAPLGLRLRAELAAGIQGNFLSQYATSNAHLEKVIDQAKTPKLESIRAQALNWRGANAVAQGELPQAKLYLEQAEVIQRKIADVVGLASTLNDIGRMVYNQENTDDRVQARAYFQKSLELANQCGDKNAQSVALQNIANSYPAATPLVFQLIEQSMEISRQLGNLGGIANRLHNLGGAMLGVGDYSKAKQYLLQSLELNLRIGRRRDAAFAVGVLAQPYVLEGHFAHGLTLFAARAAAFEQLSAQHSPAQLRYEAQFEQQARDGLGEQRAEAALARGRAMPLEQIAVFVRQDLEPFESVAFEDWLLGYGKENTMA
jgi:tetratricopeptide (TPR) repeat protein